MKDNRMPNDAEILLPFCTPNLSLIYFSNNARTQKNKGDINNVNLFVSNVNRNL
jgi:hypothetical protein